MSQELTLNVKSRVRNLEIGVGAKVSLTSLGSSSPHGCRMACSSCPYPLLHINCPAQPNKTKLAVLSKSRDMPVGSFHPISIILEPFSFLLLGKGWRRRDDTCAAHLIERMGRRGAI
jgi:hypothetical protein